MTAPIGANIGEIVETVRNAVIDLLFIRIGLVICLANAFRDDLGIAFGVAGVLAIGTLHASGVFEEVTAQGAPHNVVELLFDELVALLLNDLLLLLSYSALSVQAEVKRSTSTCLLLEAHCQVYPPSRL